MKQLKQRLLTYVLCPFLLLASPITIADNDIEISGLVIDRTLTRFGKDFGFYYSSYWRELPFTQGFNVTLYETVFPQAGTVLTLEVNGTQFTPPILVVVQIRLKRAQSRRFCLRLII